MEANYVCYFCSANMATNRHHCERECRVEGKEVIHYDFCPRCRRVILKPLVKELEAKK